MKPCSSTVFVPITVSTGIASSHVMPWCTNFSSSPVSTPLPTSCAKREPPTASLLLPARPEMYFSCIVMSGYSTNCGYAGCLKHTFFSSNDTLNALMKRCEHVDTAISSPGAAHAALGATYFSAKSGEAAHAWPYRAILRIVVYSGWPRFVKNSSFISLPENSSSFSFRPTLTWLSLSLNSTSLNSMLLSAAASTRHVFTSLDESSVAIVIFVTSKQLPRSSTM